MSTLFVVATPIGNLQDLSIRVIDVLKSVSLIAAEDTRVTRKLLNHIDSSTRTISYNENSPPSRLRQLLDYLESADLALVTDAGTPAISDPGSELVREAAAVGHAVVPVAGPSSVTAALSVSGFESTRFAFLGFLPRKKAERRRTLEENLKLPMTLVLLESPHRILQTLSDLAEADSDRDVVVCRELTKLHEEVFRGDAAAATEHFKSPRGEFVIVVAPGVSASEDVTDEELATAAEDAIADGLSGRSAVEQVMAETGVGRARAYPAVLKAQKRA